jgi:hypothetical protein
MYVTPMGYISVIGVGHSSSFYSNINSPLIGMTVSDQYGDFEIPLEPGEYSVLVWEKESYYADRIEGKYIHPVNVKEGEITTIRIVIDYNQLW